jgi:hypothetical protein
MGHHGRLARRVKEVIGELEVPNAALDRFEAINRFEAISSSVDERPVWSGERLR